VLDILELLAVDPREIGVSELARRLRIPKSSTHMLLSTLEGRGYLVSDAARRFRLHLRPGRRTRTPPLIRTTVRLRGLRLRLLT